MTIGEPQTARELLEELKRDRSSDCHWVRCGGQLLLAVRDGAGGLHAFDVIIHDESHQEAPRT
jgi:hypothetical protein